MTITLTRPVSRTSSQPTDNPWVLFAAQDGGGSTSLPEVGTQQVAGGTGTRLVRLFAAPVTAGQVRLHAEVLVRSGEVLLAATQDTEPSRKMPLVHERQKAGGEF